MRDVYHGDAIAVLFVTVPIFSVLFVTVPIFSVPAWGGESDVDVDRLGHFRTASGIECVVFAPSQFCRMVAPHLCEDDRDFDLSGDHRICSVSQFPDNDALIVHDRYPPEACVFF
jgi:hypothetical protein